MPAEEKDPEDQQDPDRTAQGGSREDQADRPGSDGVPHPAEITSPYVGGACPDCGEDIPEESEDGDECENCGHVLWGL